ncbi:hypothetical protein PIIN_11445 [Serendipita indica DSM 11827]|uniref:Uncharacterized protein n=1 Tax=Serendipita indica (strain DSM 11827) TaxID=1109443 RepID=G4U1M5_SERID|nr:hypothetical protein PIIN_11445 [Serendipita indica DSM 11827]
MAESESSCRCILKKELEKVTETSYALYWMEVLSFTRGLPRAINGLGAIARHTELEEETRNRMTEIRRFMMASFVPIQESAPHIYISGLPFSPKESKLHTDGLIKYRRTFKVTEGLEAMYSRLPRALRGHQDGVMAVGFSPDGSRIVSGSSDGTIRLWEADTGQPLGEPLRGHEAAINAVGFSPDTLQIVSGSRDGTVRLWNADAAPTFMAPETYAPVSQTRNWVLL